MPIQRSDVAWVVRGVRGDVKRAKSLARAGDCTAAHRTLHDSETSLGFIREHGGERVVGALRRAIAGADADIAACRRHRMATDPFEIRQRALLRGSR